MTEVPRRLAVGAGLDPVAATAVGRPLLDITGWGNRGTLSWDGACTGYVRAPDRLALPPAGALNRACLLGYRDAAVFDADRPRSEVWADVEPWTAPERDRGAPSSISRVASRSFFGAAWYSVGRLTEEETAR